MLLAGSRLVNLEKSLNSYLFDQLVTLYGYTVIFPRETWPNDTMPGQWIEVNYIPLSEEFATTRVQQGWGSNRMLLVNTNCFEQRQEQLGESGGLAGQYTLSAMVDQVMDTLGPRAAIPLRDYATTGTPTVAYFGWRSIRAQRIGGLEAQGLEQWNVSVTLTYPEEHV